MYIDKREIKSALMRAPEKRSSAAKDEIYAITSFAALGRFLLWGGEACVRKMIKDKMTKERIIKI